MTTLMSKILEFMQEIISQLCTAIASFFLSHFLHKRKLHIKNCIEAPYKHLEVSEAKDCRAMSTCHTGLDGQTLPFRALE